MTENQYEAPERQPVPRSGTSRWIAVFAVLVLLVGGTVWWTIAHADPDPDIVDATRCDGLDATTGEGFALHRDDQGQCLGWTVDRDHAFGTKDERVQRVVKAVVDENRAVAGGKSPYVRVAVMMPMAARPGGKLDDDSILHALEGALTAQEVANSDPEYGDVGLKVQLVLANTGWDQKAWKDVVEQLGGLTSGEHRLVAVTGLGVSVPQTRAASVELNTRWGLPSVGAVLTADDMTTRGAEPANTRPALFKVSPSNHDYAMALADSLRAEHPEVTCGFLVADRNDDNYVESLGKAFVHVFPEFDLDKHRASFTGSTTDTNQASNLFQPAVNAINALPEGKPAVVFYAGRDADLPSFVRSLATRARSAEPVVLATGMTGLTVIASGTKGKGDEALTTADLADAKVTIMAASSTDVVGWRQNLNVPERFASFRATFTGTLGFPDGDLDDGYAVMHHDAVVAAVKAARSIYSNGDGKRLPTPQDVRNGLYSLAQDKVDGASGSFHWEDTTSDNDLWPTGKPVPVVSYPRTPQPRAPYLTVCRKLKAPASLANYEVVDC
ncbi:ABC transporter substrate-binding protein [Umezawaea tangerina]|uniref:ABC-type branched-subunit amino acid transport system substrate-binding protein n=1 Tax=Umezawaea tangerina TaxID=84725 RepID=A0A2T0SMF9_9PSEU|nr:hypothetical protein [Umezawaea tangerina]PRY34585.1 ABC-type branched-subunit amino acid transport system substrate-binding protein [Umezawaea tangerina]